MQRSEGGGREKGGGGGREMGGGEGVRVVGRGRGGGGGGGEGGRRSVGRESSLCVWKCVRNSLKTARRLAGRKCNNFQGKLSPNVYVAVVTFT